MLPSSGSYADEVGTAKQISEEFGMDIIDLQDAPTRGEPIATVQLDADLDTHVDIAERIAREVYGADPDRLETMRQF